MTSAVEITRFAKSGGPLTKCIELAADGSVTNDGSACVMSRGTACRVKIDNVGHLASLIDGLQSNEAIALGALRPDLPDFVQIVTKHKLINGVAQPDVIARTSESIGYSIGQPAFALLDFDTKGSRTVYELKLDARAVQAGIEQAGDEAVVDTFVRLALAAELDDVEFQKLLKCTAERAGIGVRAVNSKFKAAKLQQPNDDAPRGDRQA